MKKVIFTNEIDFKFDDSQANDSRLGVLSGIAIPFNALSTARGWSDDPYYVRIMPGAPQFNGNTFALYHHDFSKPLARSDDGTLRMSMKEDGVHVEIDIPKNVTFAADVYNLVKSGRVKGMSFNAYEIEYTYKKEGTNTVYEYNKFSCDEVTITPIPAFVDSSIGAKFSVENFTPDAKKSEFYEENIDLEKDKLVLCRLKFENVLA